MENTPSPRSPAATTETARTDSVTAVSAVSAPTRRMSELSRRTLLQSLGIGAMALVFLPTMETGMARAQGPVTGSPIFTNRLQLPFWGDAASWNEEECYATIQAGRRMFPKTRQNADIDRDGRDELTGRGITGILSNNFDPETGQWIQLPFGPQWSNDTGWTGEQFYRTIQLADIDGDGHAELLARSIAGMRPVKYVV
ncbi:MAG: VCBS repeat-containing protein, partial [Armatimonadota bacterium]